MSNPRYTRHGQRSPGTADCAPAGPPRTGKRQDLLQIHTSSHFLMFTCSRVLMFSCSHVYVLMFSHGKRQDWHQIHTRSFSWGGPTGSRTIVLYQIPNTHFTRVQEIEGGKRPCSGTLFLQWKNNAMQETKGGQHHLGEHLGHHLGEHLGPTPGRLSGAVGQNHPGDEKTCQKTIFCPGSDLRPTSSSSKNVCASYLFTSLLIHRLPPPPRR